MPNASTALLTTSLAVVSCKKMTKGWYENPRAAQNTVCAYINDAGLTLYQSQVFSLSKTVELFFLSRFFFKRRRRIYTSLNRSNTSPLLVAQLRCAEELSAYLSRKLSRQIMWSLIRLFFFPGGRGNKTRSAVSRLELVTSRSRDRDNSETKQNKSHYRH